MINTLQHQRVSRRKSMALNTVGTIDERGFSLKAFMANLSSIEYLLAGVILVLLCFPLFHKLPSIFSTTFNTAQPLGLPEQSAANHQLFHYLIPEGQESSSSGSLDQAVIQNLKLRSYRIKQGDTLSAIAQAHGLNLDTLISYNGIRDARLLKPGTVLQLPNSNGLKYQVKRGDYLSGIARRFSVSLNGLVDWNNLQSSVIQPGQELFIPKARLSEMELNRVLGRLFIYPTRGRVSSRFGRRRDPFTGIKRFHNGVDLANKVGTPVGAAMSGKVAMTGYNANYGRYIILSHADGFQTLYGHLDSFNVRKGQRVKQGQMIAKMGNSGYSTGSHLHFSIFRKGEPVDPFKYLH